MVPRIIKPVRMSRLYYTVQSRGSSFIHLTTDWKNTAARGSVVVVVYCVKYIIMSFDAAADKLMGRPAFVISRGGLGVDDRPTRT